VLLLYEGVEREGRHLFYVAKRCYNKKVAKSSSDYSGGAATGCVSTEGQCLFLLTYICWCYCVESVSRDCRLINENLAGERDFISTVHAYGASGECPMIFCNRHMWIVLLWRVPVSTAFL
jgi:hypothetical protein